MSSWNSLPTEILNIIFNILYEITIRKASEPTNKDLFQCTLVCKGWSRQAEKYAFKTIRNHKNQTESEWVEWANALTLVKTTHRELVTSLDTGVYWDEHIVYDKVTYLDHCAELFPNVEHLQAVRPTEDFFKNLMIILVSSKWKKLAFIPYPEQKRTVPLYDACAISLKKSLKEVFVSDEVEIFTTENGEDKYNIGDYHFNLLSDRLSDFSCLQNLVISKYTISGLFEFDQAIDGCVDLRSVSYRLFHPNLDQNYDPDDVSFRDQLFQYAPNEVIQVNSQTSVKSLSVEALINADKTLDYIMKKYPQLDEIKINQVTRFGWEPEYIKLNSTKCLDTSNVYCTAKSLTEFLLYLNQIESHRAERLHTTVTDAAKAISEYWKSGNLIQQTVAIELINIDWGVFPASLFQKASISKRSARIVIAVPYIFRSALEEGQHLQYLFEHLGYNISHLTVKTRSSEVDLTSCNGISLLNKVLQRCLKLKSLLLYGTIMKFEIGGTISVTNHSLKDVTFDKIIFYEESILTNLSHSLPSLSILHLKTCWFIKRHIPNIGDYEIYLDIKYSNLEELAIIDFRWDSETIAKSLVIKIDQEEKQFSSYYKVEPTNNNRSAVVTVIDSNICTSLLDYPDWIGIHIVCKSLDSLLIIDCFRGKGYTKITPNGPHTSTLYKCLSLPYVNDVCTLF